MAKHVPLEKREFEELVDSATRDIHSGLLQGGGDGMRNAVFGWLSTVARWRDLTREKTDGKT